MFDKNHFAEILEKINSSYPTMTEFATKANLDRTYISKYINKKLNNPPTPKILEKLATASNGIASYYDLMKVCDYIDSSNEVTYSALYSYSSSICMCPVYGEIAARSAKLGGRMYRRLSSD